jgi:DNA ligase-associated metallophosphoesterase
MQVTLQGKPFTLLPEKALYSNEESLLIIADLHLGKVSHFRKEGISMPLNAQQGDYLNLKHLLDKVQPGKVYFLGDLFHSDYNYDWHHFEALIGSYSGIEFTLIKGNHDFIDVEKFERLGLRIVKELVEDECFIYSHQPVDFEHDKLNIAGHIHPGIALSGRANQSARIPCFYLYDSVLLLPAFGTLTGYSIMDRLKEAQVFAVLPGEVREI